MRLPLWMGNVICAFVGHQKPVLLGEVPEKEGPPYAGWIAHECPRCKYRYLTPPEPKL